MKKIFGVVMMFLMVSLLMFSLSSCAADDDAVGTWKAVTLQGGETVNMDVIITADTYEMMGYLASNGTDLMGEKGTYTADGETWTMTPTHDWDTTGDVWVTTSQSAHTSIVTVDGDTMTTKSDDNDDGDYTDEGETIIWSRQ